MYWLLSKVMVSQATVSLGGWGGWEKGVGTLILEGRGIGEVKLWKHVRGVLEMRLKRARAVCGTTQNDTGGHTTTGEPVLCAGCGKYPTAITQPPNQAALEEGAREAWGGLSPGSQLAPHHHITYKTLQRVDPPGVIANTQRAKFLQNSQPVQKLFHSHSQAGVKAQGSKRGCSQGGLTA